MIIFGNCTFFFLQFQVAVIVTNQLVGTPPKKTWIDEMVAEFSATQLGIRKSRGSTRIAEISYSVDVPEGRALFKILPRGGGVGEWSD